MAIGDETIRDFTTPSGDPLIGTVVDSYRVESVVGSGAMGIVYRGVHMVIGKPVAIKVLKADFADDPEMVQRLVREARTVNAIRHPSIVDAFGFGTLPRSGQPYIVMDLLVGEPLDAWIEREAPVSLRVASGILDELLSALAAAHQVGVIHRDLKPGNCFLESQPNGARHLKLLDFGLARQANRAGGSIRPTNPGSLIGTPAFMAPEQVGGKKLTPATDLYAVGGIAYQMLTGHLPHEGPTAIDVLTQKMKYDPVRPRQWNSSLSEEADEWVMRLLERDPERRERDAEVVRKHLRYLTDSRTMPSIPLSASRPALKREKEVRTVVIETPTSKSAEASTAGHHSPWAEPTDAPQVSPFSNSIVPNATPPAPTILMTASHAMPPVLLAPTEPQVAAVTVTPQERPTAPSPPPHRATVKKSSGNPLIIALLITIAALVAGLLWLIRML